LAFFRLRFDTESFDMLIELGLDQIKIPSGEITNLPFLRHIARSGKRVILSTGMATLGDIEATIDVLEQAGTPRSNITVLHCTTEYPTPWQRSTCALCKAFKLLLVWQWVTLTTPRALK
jgi:N,N'-diacetyllegionaminate synthase